MLRMKLLAAGVLVTLVAGAFANAAGWSVEPAPFLIGVAVVLAAIAAWCGYAWTIPAADRETTRQARVVRTTSAAALATLTAALAMFTLGRGAFVARQMLLPLVIGGELLLIVAIAHRAVWYGKHPEALADLIAARDQAEAARAESLPAAGDDRGDGDARMFRFRDPEPTAAAAPAEKVGPSRIGRWIQARREAHDQAAAERAATVKPKPKRRPRPAPAVVPDPADDPVPAPLLEDDILADAADEPVSPAAPMADRSPAIDDPYAPDPYEMLEADVSRVDLSGRDEEEDSVVAPTEIHDRRGSKVWNT